MIELRRALLANKDEVATAIAAAERELAACQQQCNELADLIERGRLVLGLSGREVRPTRRSVTLHEAIATILREHGEAMTAPAIVGEINRRSLYRQRDSRPVGAAQIHARVGSYGHLFERRNRRIALREVAGS